jgi:hypothetical protein
MEFDVIKFSCVAFNPIAPKNTTLCRNLPSEDVKCTDNLFVVGGFASLNMGPDAANLMGMRAGLLRR